MNAAAAIVLHAGAARRARDQQRIRAAARDDSEGVRRFHSYDERDALSRDQRVPPALDVQLRERFLQRRLNGRDFFGAVIFFHRRLRARDGRFGCALVDRRGFERDIGQDGNALAPDLDEAFADREERLASAFQNAQLARLAASSAAERDSDKRQAHLRSRQA